MADPISNISHYNEVWQWSRLPEWDCILTAADSAYLHSFGPGLIASAVEHGVSVHITVMQPDSLDEDTQRRNGRDWSLLKSMAAYAQGRINFTAEAELYDPSEVPSSMQKRVFFACGRLRAALRASESIAKGLGEKPNPSWFLLDIDSIIKAPIKFPESEVCFYYTDPCGVNEIENRGTHLLASCFVRPSVRPYLFEVIKHIKLDRYAYWFADQVYLWECLPSWRHLATKMNDLNILDVDFVEGTSVWTGRGPRKYTEVSYMSEAAYWKDKFHGRR